MSDETVTEVIYRWHQIMFRLDEMDEIVMTGLTEEEAANFDAERSDLQRELTDLEQRLGVARVGRLKASHETDRAYARQMRQIDEEKSSS